MTGPEQSVFLEGTSTQPCGCDPRAYWVCEQHRKELLQPPKLVGIEDSGKRMQFESGSQRDPSEGKLKWSRIFFGPLARRWAQHLTTAEAKYPDVALGVPNFTLVNTQEELLRYKESALRHFMSWYFDETNEDHAAAVCFNINGVEIVKDKRRGVKIDGITY